MAAPPFAKKKGKKAPPKKSSKKSSLQDTLAGYIKDKRLASK